MKILCSKEAYFEVSILLKMFAYPKLHFRILPFPDVGNSEHGHFFFLG